MRSWKIYGFLVIELALYSLILTTGGDVLRLSSYGAIIVCFLYALSFGKNGNHWIQAGLACTAAADLCLVILDPIQRLWGMVFFLGAQTFYAVSLHKTCKYKVLLWLRGILSCLAIVITLVVLGAQCDALALVSMVYYVNLIMNIITAFFDFSRRKMMAIGFVLFLLCDTVIGLQVAAGSYLPIAQGSLLHRIIFMDFNLSWFFYLPSQVILAISAGSGEIR